MEMGLLDDADDDATYHGSPLVLSAPEAYVQRHEEKDEAN